MTQINKSAIISQLTTDISSLTVGAEDNEALLLYLKTALNAGVSAENIVTELEARIGNASTSDSIITLVHLVKSLELITKDRSITVSDVDDLSVINDIGKGSIVFVENENETYILMSTGIWEPLFRTVILGQNAYAWGSNGSGQLGDSTSADRSSPVSLVGGFTDWISANAGNSHSLGVRANGTLWAWGYNFRGQLGDDTSILRSSPVSVVGGFTDWISVSAGGGQSLGIRSNGTIWAWGINGSGQLGDNTTTSRSSPVSVVGGFTDWISASAGGSHSLGVRANGTLWAWGSNGSGQLGDNTIANRLSPVSVVGGFADWISVSAGSVHSIGVRANGTLWAWGSNGSGRLGDGTDATRSSPVSVVGGFTDWVSASGGGLHSLGVRANGTLWAWGYNSSGQLGNNTLTDHSSPVSVVGGFTDWISASGGEYHNIALRANGTLWAWGSNGTGRLGDGTTTSRSSPVSVIGGFTDWISASAGYSHSLVIRSGS